MRSMILAAGLGTRMGVLTATTPKPMLQVNGKPLIQYHVEHLMRSGITDIVINHALFGEQIEQYLGTGEALGARITYSPEKNNPLGTAGGIVAALPLLGDKPFVIVNADIWTDFPFQQLQTGLTDNALAHIILVDNPSHNTEGDFYLDHGWLCDQGDTGQLLPRLTYSGISIFTPEFFQGYLCQSQPLALLLCRAASQRQVTASHYQGEWYDIGTPERLQELRQRYSV